MSVSRLRTANDRQYDLGLDRLRSDIVAASGSVDRTLVGRLLTLVDREQSARTQGRRCGRGGRNRWKSPIIWGFSVPVKLLYRLQKLRRSPGWWHSG